jgi:hypothetical protein
VPLISKASLFEIWSLAPAIDITDCTLEPYDSIIQFTGTRLRDVSLCTTRDFPSIVKHLDANCPHLETVSFSVSVLRSFNLFHPHVARLLSRVSHLTIFERSDPPPNENFDDWHTLQQLLSDAAKIKRISISHIFFDFTPMGPGREIGLQRVIDLLKPSLRSVRVSMTGLKLMLDAVQHCELLEEFLSAPVVRDKQFKRLGKRLIDTLSSTKVGANITFIDSHKSSGVEWELLPAMLVEIGCKCVIEILETSHLKRAIHPRHCVQIMAQYCVDKPAEIEPFVTSLANGAYKSLPPLADVIPYLYQEGFWMTAASYVPVATIRALVEQLGPPVADEFDASCGLVARSDFSEETIQSLKSCGLIGDPHFLRLSDQQNCNIFHFVKTCASLEWIVSHMNDQDITQLIHQPSSNYCGTPMSYWIAQECPQYVHALISRLGEKAVLSLTNAAGQRSAIINCALSGNTGLLERIVAATGLSNFTSETLGGILWDLAFNNYCDNRFFVYWVDLLEKNPSVEPDLWADDGTHLERVFLETRQRLKNSELDLILTKFAVQIARQASEVSSRPVPLLIHLAEYLFFCGSKARNSIALDLEMIIEKIFTPVARASAHVGESAVALLAVATSEFFKKKNINQAVFDTLLQICLNIDFAPDATEDQLDARRLKIAQFLHHLSLKDTSSCTTFVERLVDLLTAKELNATNLMEVLLSKGNAPLLPNMPEFVVRLVECGARLGAKERTVNELNSSLDLQALEIYYEAIRGLSHKRTIWNNDL